MAQQVKKISDGQPLLNRRFDINFTGNDITTYIVASLDTNDQKLKVNKDKPNRCDQWVKRHGLCCFQVFRGDSVNELPVTEIVKSWCLSNAGDQLALGFVTGNVEVRE